VAKGGNGVYLATPQGKRGDFPDKSEISKQVFNITNFFPLWPVHWLHGWDVSSTLKANFPVESKRGRFVTLSSTVLKMTLLL